MGGTSSVASPQVLARQRGTSSGGGGTLALGSNPVRLKSVYADSADAAEQRAIKRELAAHRRLQQHAESGGGSCHLVRLLDALEHPDAIHLVLEPTYGGTLRDRLVELAGELTGANPGMALHVAACVADDNEVDGTAGGMDEAEALGIVTQIAHALHALHAAGIAHRALAPECVYYADAGRTTVKLGSLDCAEISTSDEASRASLGSKPAGARGGGSGGSGIGSGAGGLPHYRAPELWLAGAAGMGTEGAADIWALGCIAYECLHARPAFDGDTLPSLSLQVKRVAHRAVSSCLSDAAANLIRACLVREPMLRAGPRQMNHLYLNAWQRVLGVGGRAGGAGASSVRAVGRVAKLVAGVSSS